MNTYQRYYKILKEVITCNGECRRSKWMRNNIGCDSCVLSHNYKCHVKTAEERYHRAVNELIKRYGKEVTISSVGSDTIMEELL